MSDGTLGGVLALRESWCQPNETILLTWGAGRFKFDVPGLDWHGKAQKGFAASIGMGALNSAAWLDTPIGEFNEIPPAIVFGSADGIAMRLLPNLEPTSTEERMWVLTPLRLAHVKAQIPNQAPHAERSLKTTWRDLTSVTRDIVAGKAEYPPHQHIQTKKFLSEFEIPNTEIASVAPANRQLPRGNRYPEKSIDVVRLTFVDGSGFDIYARKTIQRLINMVSGRE